MKLNTQKELYVHMLKELSKGKMSHDMVHYIINSLEIDEPKQ
jgi:hypothetical protein